MNIYRALNVTSGLFLIAFGLIALLAPTWLASAVGLVASASGATEVRGVMGGMHMALGVYLLLTSSKDELLPQGMQLSFYIASGLLFGHLYGVAKDGSATPLLWVLMAIELIWFCLILNAMFLNRPEMLTPRRAR